MDHYGTVAGFRTYHEARGRDVTDYGDDTVVLASLRVASEWIDGVYRRMFSGWKTGQRAQVREWPRTGVVDYYGYLVPSDSVPTEVENATYEAALRQLQSPGSLTVDYTPNKYKRVSIEGAVSVEFATPGGAGDIQTQFAIIDQILDPLIGGKFSAGISGSVSRA